MASISSAGIGSGLDVEGIVSKLVALERKPLQTLQQHGSVLQTRLSALGQVKSQLAALAEAATALSQPAGWNRTSATSADASAVAATATGAATSTGEWQVQVQQLAAGQAVRSATWAANSGLGAGTLSFQTGTWSGDGSAFSASADAPTVIHIAAGHDTPAEVAAAVNAANGPVRASVVTDRQGTRLVFSSRGTGEAAGFTVAATAVNAGSSLESLGFDASGGGLVRTRAAQDALLTIDGVSLQSASNSSTSLIPDLRLDLQHVTTQPVTVTARRDAAHQRELINTFVGAYNTLQKTLTDATAYNPTTGTAGTLQSDGIARSIQGLLRRTALAQSTEGDLRSLSAAGLSLARDGSLQVREDTLTAALANDTALGALLQGSTVAPGIAGQLATLANALIGTDGAITQRSTALQANLRRNDSEQTRINERVSRVEQRLRAQYGALDGSLSGLNALSAYVSQQITLWNKNTG